MSGRYDDAMRGLNSRVMASFGRPVVLIAPDGRRFGIAGDWRQEPVLLDDGGHGAVSSYQPTVGIDLAAWPPEAPRIEDDWSGWLLEIPAASATADIRAGRWSVANVARPGGGWIDLELINFAPF